MNIFIDKIVEKALVDTGAYHSTMPLKTYLAYKDQAGIKVQKIEKPEYAKVATGQTVKIKLKVEMAFNFAGKMFTEN